MNRTLEHLFKKELKMKVLVKSVTTLGQRIYLVALENKEHNIRIMKNKSKLGKLTREMICIDNNYTSKEHIQKNVRKRVVEERQRGSQVKT